MEIGRKSIETLAKEFAKGWSHELNKNQRDFMTNELVQLINAIVEREKK